MPRNSGAAPEVGQAQTCTASTPVPLGASTSIAQPASVNGVPPRSPLIGASMVIYRCLTIVTVIGSRVTTSPSSVVSRSAMRQMPEVNPPPGRAVKLNPQE
jgi:hypothetical protein